jgi:hypothetical protein
MPGSKGDRKAKYSKEIEEIKRMNDLGRILKAGDLENALLSNSAKDSETMNDSVLDSLLSKADAYDQGNQKGLEVIERLTTRGAGVTRQKRVEIRRVKGKVKVRRSFHIVKRKKASRPKRRKASRKRR